MRGDLTLIIQKVKHNVNMLTNMHHSPAEGDFCNEHEKAMKPATVQDTWGMWTRATTWWTVTPLAIQWKRCFSPSGPLNSGQFYNPFTSCGSKLPIKISDSFRKTTVHCKSATVKRRIHILVSRHQPSICPKGLWKTENLQSNHPASKPRIKPGIC